MSEIVVIVRYTAQPDQAARALEEIRALVHAVLEREPQCAGIEVLCDLADAAAITLVERWPDQASFLGPHLQQPHLQDFIRRAASFLAGPPAISFHACVDAG